jgi:TRAP-type C4-dicarboxylate transport system permease large subunit
LISALSDTVVASATVMLVVAMAGIFSWAASTLGVIGRGGQPRIEPYHE